MLSQTLILNKTDTLALFSLPHDKIQNMKRVPCLKKTVRKFLITYPMMFIQKNHVQLSKTNHRQFAWIKVCFEVPLSEDSSRSVDIGLKLRVCKMFRWRSRHCGCILNVLFAISLCPLSRGNACFRNAVFENSSQWRLVSYKPVHWSRCGWVDRFLQVFTGSNFWIERFYPSGHMVLIGHKFTTCIHGYTEVSFFLKFWMKNHCKWIGQHMIMEI